MNQIKKRLNNLITSEEFIVNSILFLLFLVIALMTLEWPNKPRLFPLGVSMMCLVLLALRLTNMIRKGEATPVKRISWKVPAGFIALGLTIPLAFVTGLAPAVGLLGAGLAILYGERRWWVIILIGGFAFSLMYFLFGMVLQVPMEF
jgi:hypothetical protein